MLFGQIVSAGDWGAWTGYEVALAVVVLAKSVSCLRRGARVTRAGLEGWVALAVFALFVALGLGLWLESSFLTGLIAFGLGCGIILSAAVNVAYQVGLKDGERMRHTEASKS